VALRFPRGIAIHFIFSLSFLHYFLVLLISHVFHFLTVCQKVKAENPNFSVLLGRNFLLLAEWEAEYINMLDSKLVLPWSTNVPVLEAHVLFLRGSCTCVSFFLERR
jgi:hypothetical protein